MKLNIGLISLIVMIVVQLNYITSYNNNNINVHRKLYRKYHHYKNRYSLFSMSLNKNTPTYKTYTKDTFDVEIIPSSTSSSSSSSSSSSTTTISEQPPMVMPNNHLQFPYNNILSFDNDAIIYEISVDSDILGIIRQADSTLLVDDISNNDNAKMLGLQKDDIIIEIKDYEKSNISRSIEGMTKYFKTNSKAILRIKRPLSHIDDAIKETLLVPYSMNVKLRRPLGLFVRGIDKGSEKGVYIQAMKPGLGASKSKRLEVGDQIVAISASWGDRMWDISSVQSFVLGVEMRTFSDMYVTVKRFVPITSPLLINQRIRNSNNNNFDNSDMSMDSDVIDLIEKITNINQLKQVYDKIVSMKDNESIFNVVIINRLMTVAIKIEQIQFAIDIFENIFDFKIDTTSSGDVLKLLDKAEEIETGFSRGKATENKFDISKISSSAKGPLLEPNVFVCTTAVKAYGRKKDVQKALALLPFLESKGLSPDIYFFTSLLYILGKVGMVPEAEQLFWQEIPKRNLSYTVATTNSLMYMYAKLNRADDALKIYELTKRTGLACTVVTYGVLLKALIRSGKKQLQDTSFEILSSLQDIGIEPGIQVYNQFLEYFGRTMDFRQMKAVLSIMNNSKPRVKPDVISYGYMINGFADAKKPRSALKLFSDMCNRGIPPNVQTYMGVLKAFARLRDGVSSVQVLSEMREKGVEPDLRCYATAMFTCVVGNQCSLAEAIFANALKLRVKPDTVIYSLLLRALLQQGKWSEGEDLFRRMKNGQELAKPNQYTFGWMLQFYILDNRFEDALQLIDTIVENYHVPNKRTPNSKQKQFQILSLSTTFDALSFALGSSSTKIERIRQEDKLSSQQKTVAALENAFREDNLIPKSEEGSALTKPTINGLKFLTTCCEKICNADNGYIPCDFYAELLYALVTENMPDEIQRLLVLREAGQVKLKDVMKAKISSTESLALALLKSNKK